MSNNLEQTSQDKFLGGALSVTQPIHGYRAATDPVFLAASIPINSGDSVLELGCGVGVALLCLNCRVPNLALTGLELQADYAEMARKNMHNNQCSAEIIKGDLTDMPTMLRKQSFDHVIFNPPFYAADQVSHPTNQGRSTAHVSVLDIGDWIDAGLKRLKPKGHMTFIHRAEILPAALAALIGRAGDICIKPLTSRINQPAKRVIVTCRKGSKGPAKLLPALIIHDGDQHSEHKKDYSDIANAVLRKGDALIL